MQSAMVSLEIHNFHGGVRPSTASVGGLSLKSSLDILNEPTSRESVSQSQLMKI